VLISPTWVTLEAPTSLISEISAMWTRVVSYVCRGKTWIILIVLRIHGSKRCITGRKQWMNKHALANISCSQKRIPTELYMQHYITEQKEYAKFSTDYSQQI
jgi:hypothetical protein